MSRRQTTTTEVRVAREMRAKGRRVMDIAGELDRDPRWVYRHTSGTEPFVDRLERQNEAMDMREKKKLPYDYIAMRLGYSGGLSARIAVHRARRRRQKEMSR